MCTPESRPECTDQQLPELPEPTQIGTRWHTWSPEVEERQVGPSRAHGEQEIQGNKAVPCDLNTDAEQNERYDAEDAMRGGGRNGSCDLRCVGICEIDKPAEHNGGEKDAEMSEDAAGDP